jgi:hypothetical protein
VNKMKKAISGLVSVVLATFIAIPNTAYSRGYVKSKRGTVPQNLYTFSRTIEAPAYLTCFYKVCEIEYSTVHKRNIDFCQFPHETISWRKGDCKDMAFYLYYLLKDNGEKSRVVIGKLREEDEPYHAWIEYIYKGELLILDPATRRTIKRSSLKKDDPQYKEVNFDSTNKQIKAYMEDYETWLKDNKMPK